MKKVRIFLAILAAAAVLAGCGSGAAASTQPSTEAAAQAQEVTTQATEAASPLDDIELDLLEGVTRQRGSETADYFYKDGEIVGGIAALDPSAADLEDYCAQAVAVTQAVYDTDYDSMAGSSTICQAEVSLANQEKREFNHYFFTGTDWTYDVWMDAAVVGSRDMTTLLQSLQGGGLVNPQDTAPAAEEEPPILRLRAEVPEGITWMPSNFTRALLYSGENADTLVGGVEKIEKSEDLDTLGIAALNLAEEFYAGSFGYLAADWSDNPAILATITTNGGQGTDEGEGVFLFHTVVQVEEDCYDVWVDTAALTEEQCTEIALSCRYQ